MFTSSLLRRDLFRGAAALTAASYSRILGANDRVRLGLIGSGDRGRHVMSQFQATKQVDVVAVCDIYGQQVDQAQQRAPGAKAFTDHRKLLEMKDMDVA